MKKFLPGILAGVAVVFVFALFAASGRCGWCGGASTAGAVDAAGIFWCSEACWEKALPVCAVCNGKCRNGAAWLSDIPFCSPGCLNKNPYPACTLCNTYVREYRQLTYGRHTLSYCQPCSQLPLCFVCSLPCNGQLTGSLKIFCSNCASSAAVAAETAQYGLAKELPSCSQCGRICRENAYSVNSQVFCSDDCLDANALSCTWCEELYWPGTGSEGFCSLACFQKSRSPICRKCESNADPRILRENNGICSWCRKKEQSGQPKVRRRYVRSRTRTIRTIYTGCGAGGAKAPSTGAKAGGAGK